MSFATFSKSALCTSASGVTTLAALRRSHTSAHQPACRSGGVATTVSALKLLPVQVGVVVCTTATYLVPDRPPGTVTVMVSSVLPAV